MAFCRNCGAPVDENAKFCAKCGAVQITQQVQQSAQQPVQPAPQPVYQQPVQSVYQQPAQPIQPVQPAKKSNGLCTAGLVLSLVGIITVGLTSIIGLILSVVGLIVANSKKQNGKGKAIAGIIIAVVTMLTVVGAYEFFDKIFWNLDVPSKDPTPTTVSAEKLDPREELIVNTKWLERSERKYLVFGSGKEFELYTYYEDHSDNYAKGTYEMFFGKDAIEKLKKDYTDSGMTEEDVREMIEENPLCNEDNFVIIVLHTKEQSIDGDKTTFNDGTGNVYAGFIVSGGEFTKELNISIFPVLREYNYIPEEVYNEKFPPETESTDVTEDAGEDD